MIPVNKIENLIKIYADLEKELSSGSVDKKEYASKSKNILTWEVLLIKQENILILKKKK